MPPKSKRLLIGLAALAALAAGLMLLREWRGPAVSGYRVDARPLVQTVVAAGRVIGVSRVQIGSEIIGVVTERRVEEGDEVAAGDVLVVLRADDLAARVREAEAALAQLERSARPRSEVALREAEVRLAQASRETERRRDLFERNLIAREAIEQAEEAETLARAAVERARLEADALAPGGSEETLLRERLAAARAALEKTVVRSEVAGVVLTRNAEPGDLVQPGRVLFEIERSGDTEILVPFDEENLAVLEIGQEAMCVADAFPSQPFGAEIVFISPRIDPQRGSVDVRLRVSPVPHFLRQDMTVSVNVETGRRERALGEDFIARLAALVPKPRANLTRYHGVFAPASPDRSRIVPGTRAAAAKKARECGEPSASDRQRAMTWAQRLKRVFAIDIEICRSCGGKLRVIASIEDSAVVERILEHLGRDAAPVDAAAHPSRAPPQGDLSL